MPGVRMLHSRIDHQEARILHVQPEGFDESKISSPNHHVHRHPKGPGAAAEHPDDAQRFFHEVVQALAETSEILIAGFTSLGEAIHGVLQDVGLTILFVTPDFDEALYVAQRIVMLSASPGSVAEIIDVRLPYPRNQVQTRREPTYLELRGHLYDSMVQQVIAGREAS